MNSYFVRHKNLAVNPEDLDRLWEDNKIAIHYPGDGRGPDSESIEPGDYRRSDKGAIGCFKELSEKGGYVWAESERQTDAKIGRVQPQEYKPFRTTWIKNSDPRYKHKTDSDEAVLKVLQLVDFRPVHPGTAMGLRAGRPRGTICRWKKCGRRLEALVKKDTPDYEWDDLSTELQEAACAEYLRLHDDFDLPKLQFLLLPVGKTLEDVDIFGMSKEGERIFAQVTFLEKENSQDKIERLKKYVGQGNKVIYFCKCSMSSEEDSVFFIDVGRVWEWISKNPIYKDHLFSREGS